MNPRLVESRVAVNMIGRERKARAAAPETGSRASLSRRLLALAVALLGLADSFAPYDFEAWRKRSALHPSLTRLRRAA